MHRYNNQDISEIIKKWSDNGYPYLSDEEYAKTEDFFVKMIRLRQAGDEEAKDNMENVLKNLRNPPEVEFNLGEFLLNKVKHCSVFTLEQETLFSEKLRNMDINFSIPYNRLCRNDKYIKLCDESDVSHYQERVNRLLDKILRCKKEPNLTLVSSLKESPLIFLYENCISADAGIEIANINGVLRPIIDLHSGMFSDKVSDDLLAFTICHELGHWLDKKDRPEKYLGENKLCREIFADMFGYKMASNAGFDMECVLADKKSFAEYQRSQMEKKGKVFGKTIFEERYEFFREAFEKEILDNKILKVKMKNSKEKYL